MEKIKDAALLLPPVTDASSLSHPTPSAHI